MSTLAHNDRSPPVFIPRFRVRAISGDDAGLEASSEDGRLVVGTGDGADLRLGDRTVSRFHVELEATDAGIVVRDLGSTNGTIIGALRVREALVQAGSAVVIDVGRTRLQLVLGDAPAAHAAARTSFGAMI